MGFAKYMAAALVAAGSLASVPAFAESGNGQTLINGAVKTVPMIKSDARFEHMLAKAKGVVIFPTMVKAAFLVGGSGAQGVLLKHNSDGSWSDPAFVTLGSVSAGLQAGGKAGPVAFLLMTKKALGDMTQANNFSLNANSGLTIVGYSAKGQAPVGKGDIVIWSDQSGAFAGGSFSGADITQNTTEDHTYYSKPVDAVQVLKGDAHQSGAQKLVQALPS